jgi:transposase
VSKYQDALPLYRQETIIKRYGIELPRATLANWMIKTSDLLTPLINLMREHLLSGPLIHMDETPVQVLKEPDKPARSKSYMWVQVGGQADKAVRLFDYHASRSSQIPIKLLDGYQGLLMTDGYEGYKTLARHSAMTQLTCWAHARRKFMDAQKAQKNKTGKAQMALNFIQKLYAIEGQIKHKTVEERYQTRQQQSKPMIEKLETWLMKSIEQVPPTGALGKALHYLNNQWPTLVRYIDTGDGVIDNNPAENAIRPFVVGRKNWLFSSSVKGANASAVLYSVIETAKANGLEPFAYLQQVFKALPNAETVEQIEALLPWNVSLTC